MKVVALVATIVVMMAVSTGLACLMGALAGYPLTVGQGFVLAWGWPLLQLTPFFIKKSYAEAQHQQRVAGIHDHPNKIVNEAEKRAHAGSETDPTLN